MVTQLAVGDVQYIFGGDSYCACGVYIGVDFVKEWEGSVASEEQCSGFCCILSSGRYLDNDYGDNYVYGWQFAAGPFMQCDLDGLYP